MREAFQAELREYLDKLLTLGNAANEAISKSLKAFNDRDKEAAHDVVAGDLKINLLATEIEQEAYRIIALQQPVATDLRKVFAVLLASSDIERLADHAAAISKSIIRRSENSQKIDELDAIINKMAAETQSMISDALDAFMTKDANKAREVAYRDNIVDEYLKDLYTEASARMVGENQVEVVNLGIAYVGIGNNIERIGDYVTNICERIVYLESGDIIELD